MALLSRRAALLASALPASGNAVPASASVPAMAAEFHRLASAVPGLERARNRAARLLTRAEEEFHHTQDAASRVVDWLEVAPLATLADAQALRGVALALVREGRDPARHELLLAADEAIAAIRAEGGAA